MSRTHHPRPTSSARGATDAVRRLLARGPIYEGLIPYAAGIGVQDARRALRYLSDRGEASRDSTGTWSSS